jgi:cation diffusion facilitator CzcD-associated flavoprotein CzcO
MKCVRMVTLPKHLTHCMRSLIIAAIAAAAAATTPQVESLRAAGATVAVVGYGKTAIDIAAQTAAAGVPTQHVFRKASWVVPYHLFGIHSEKKT